MNVLHFAGNAGCIPLSVGLFEEALPNQNRWRVLGLPADRASALMQAVSDDYFTSAELASDMEWADLLICHSMHPSFIPAVERAPSPLCVVWSMWGFDYVDLVSADSGGMYLPETAALRRKHTMASVASPGVFVRLVRRFGHAVRRRLAPRSTGLARIAGRINYLFGPTGDVSVLKALIPELSAVELTWSNAIYYTVEDNLAKGPRRAGGAAIQLGNSATYTNNHLDAIHLLASHSGLVQSVICPLSYGSARYAEHVALKGTEVFGDRFKALRQIVPITEYWAHLGSCGCFIMNSRRQQGMGNVLQALYAGAVVLLRSENTNLAILRQMGLQLRAVDDIESGGRSALEPLTVQQTRANTAIISERWSRRAAVQEIRTVLGHLP